MFDVYNVLVAVSSMLFAVRCSLRVACRVLVVVRFLSLCVLRVLCVARVALIVVRCLLAGVFLWCLMFCTRWSLCAMCCVM